MLEIRPKDISELDDKDLRTLVGLLCEAQMHSQGISPAGVTWGGHQNSKDGGIDVRVDLTAPFDSDDFVPRNQTGIQVKESDLAPAAIRNEMQPNGQIRPAIIELAKLGGAYIIVIGKSFTSDKFLKRRKRTMREVISGLEEAGQLKVDYYDAGRIASWVRTYPAMILWVRWKIGKPIQGWYPYQNWANPKESLDEPYLLDEGIRLYGAKVTNPSGLSVIDGINTLRYSLRVSQASVRLVGLSGVGKTRLVQALFDVRIGQQPLEKSQVCYTDVGYEPIPSPVQFVQQLVAFNKPILLIVDNCSPGLHRTLAKICSNSSSMVRLLTIEYDVRDDLPEDTDVFHLEPASDNLIEKLIRKRQKHISQVDAKTIAKLAGGNARLAIVLAKTVKIGENLSSLRDEQLFERLFIQRKKSSDSLLKSAEVCALVYSFNSQMELGENNELSLLSGLSDIPLSSLYRDIKEIEDRHLIQSRRYWKAVLPHALANKLAQSALRKIPLDRLLSAFEAKAPERLLQSFSRRLGYLHESEEAISIAKRWLAPDGLLGNLSQIDRLKINILHNITPICPEVALFAIERTAKDDDSNQFLSHDNLYAKEISHLLRALAYDPTHFKRAVTLLCKMTLTERRKEDRDSIRHLINSLFYIKLSGTHATIEQRLVIIKQFINANDDEQQDLGLSLLDSALKAANFRPHYEFTFGARSRNYGAYPKTQEEVLTWYKPLLDFALKILRDKPKLAAKVKMIVAENFSGLWNYAKIPDQLENVAKEILTIGHWNEGWVAARNTLRIGSKNMPDEVVTRLQRLVSDLKPSRLIDQARLYVLTPNHHLYALFKEDEDNSKKTIEKHDEIKAICRGLGGEIADKTEIFLELLPELLSQKGTGVFEFGQGMINSNRSPVELWKILVEQLKDIAPDKRNYELFGGFLNALSRADKSLAEDILDKVVEYGILAPVYPYLQAQVEINERGVARLIHSIELGISHIGRYSILGNGKIHYPIDDAAFLNLVELVATKPDGYAVAIDMLHMRLYSYKNDKKEINDELIRRSQIFVINFQFSEKSNHSHSLAHH